MRQELIVKANGSTIKTVVVEIDEATESVDILGASGKLLSSHRIIDLLDDTYHNIDKCECDEPHCSDGSCHEDTDCNHEECKTDSDLEDATDDANYKFVKGVKKILEDEHINTLEQLKEKIEEFCDEHN